MAGGNGCANEADNVPSPHPLSAWSSDLPASCASWLSSPACPFGVSSVELDQDKGQVKGYREGILEACASEREVSLHEPKMRRPQAPSRPARLIWAPVTRRRAQSCQTRSTCISSFRQTCAPACVAHNWAPSARRRALPHSRQPVST